MKIVAIHGPLNLDGGRVSWDKIGQNYPYIGQKSADPLKSGGGFSKICISGGGFSLVGGDRPPKPPQAHL